MARGGRDVYIVKVGTEYRVRPAIAAVQGQTQGNAKQNVVFRNATDDSVTIIFPTGTMDKAEDVKVVAKRAVATFTLADVAEVTAVSYMVFASSGGALIPAKGESEPVIIIDP